MKKSCSRILLALSLLLTACIKNDIPYPVVELEVLGVSGKGFTCAESDIDRKNRIVTLHLDETTDISRVQIDSISITSGGKTSVPLSGEFDLRGNMPITLSLYQDYDWTLHAEQQIERIFTVKNQIGSATFDVAAKTATAYVPSGTDMNNIQITELKLGPKEITTMTPSSEELTVFETYRQVYIQYHDFKETWRLYVIPTDISIQFTQTDAWSRVLWLYAAGKSGTSLGFRYRKSGDTQWTDVPADKITIDGGSLSTRISGLEPETSYEVIAFSDENETEIVTLKTDPESVLTNGDFETWCTEKDIVYPGPSKESSYWGTGNPGAAIAGATLTSSTTDKRPGSPGTYAAHLQSKLAGIAGIGRLAAGNLFIGQYVGTRGTNGIVGFGRPYTLRPTPEEYGVCEKEDGNKQVGTNEVPICIDTRDPNTFFNPKSPAVVAYGEMVLTESIAEWQQFTIKLDYNTTHTVPTHLVIVCSASRYGDYYIGSRDSEMWIDDFELVYDYEE